VSTAGQLEHAVSEWLRKAIHEKGLEIVDGQVTADKFEVRKAYRQALKDVLAELPGIAKKVNDR
jgi:hypothetical protein